MQIRVNSRFPLLWWNFRKRVWFRSQVSSDAFDALELLGPAFELLPSDIMSDELRTQYFSGSQNVEAYEK